MPRVTARLILTSSTRTPGLRVRPEGLVIVPQVERQLSKERRMLSRFGRQQLKIMLILWERGQATAREVAEELSRERRVAYSTVQTILRRLEEKGAVTHDVEGRTFVFRPLLEPEKVRANGVHEILGRIFDDSPGELIAHLLQHEHFSPEERQDIREILQELTEESGKTQRKHKKRS